MVIYPSLILGLFLCFCGMLAWNTVRPKLNHLQTTPLSAHKLPYEAVSYKSSDGVSLSGWLIPAGVAAPLGIIILCHGVDGTRLSVMREAIFLHRAGFSCLVFDFRGRGESGDAICTIGYKEVDDLLATVRFVATRPELKQLPLGVFGHSQGGAVALMAAARESRISAVVAESPFARLSNAINNHFRSKMGIVAPLFAYPVRWIGQAFIHANVNDIAPVDEINKISPRPIFLIEDMADELCPPAETSALLAAAGNPKSIWRVPNAGHIQAGSVAPAEFEKRVTQFFRENLSGGSS